MIDRLLSYPVHGLMASLREYIRYAPNDFGKDPLLRTFHILRRLFFFDTRSKLTAFPSRKVVVDTVFGAKLECKVPSDQISTYLYLFGIWEPHITEWIKSRLSPGDVFVDVGANLGYYSLLAAQQVGPRGSVVAVEASPSIFKLLERNVQLNDASNIRCVQRAVLEKPGTVKIYRGPEYNMGLTTTLTTMSNCSFEAEVQAGPLGDMLHPDEISRVRLIKVDVEGAEWSVVRGLEPLLPKLRPDAEIVIEIAPLKGAAHGETPETILSMFRSHGFHFYALENDYRAGSYLRDMKAPTAPRRVETVDKQLDLIVTRAELT